MTNTDGREPGAGGQTPRQPSGEQSLHAAMLPYLAVLASTDTKYSADARAHLNALLGVTPSTRERAKGFEALLANERGSLLEPFSCPPPLPAWIGVAVALLVDGAFMPDDKTQSVILIDGNIDRNLLGRGGVRPRWSGLEFSKRGVAPFRIQDFRRRVAQQRTPGPTVPLAFDLHSIAATPIKQVSTGLQLDGDKPSLSVRIDHQEFHGSNGRAPRVTAHMHFIADGIPPVLGKAQFRDKGSSTELSFDMNPTTLLRIAAIPGPKRFVLRIDEAETPVKPYNQACTPSGRLPAPPAAGSSSGTPLHEELVVGSFDENGARAVWLPRDGWSDCSRGWLPAVHFVRPSADQSDSASTAAPELGQSPPGTIAYLIDLLVRLHGVAPRDADGPSASEQSEQLLSLAERDFLNALRRQLHRDATSSAGAARR